MGSQTPCSWLLTLSTCSAFCSQQKVEDGVLILALTLILADVRFLGKRYNNTAKMEKDSQMIAALDETEQANFKEIQKLLKETKANEKAKLVAVVDPPRYVCIMITF